jgi:hypothetical protein
MISSILVSEMNFNSWFIIISCFHTRMSEINMCHLFVVWPMLLSKVVTSMNVDTRRQIKVIHSPMRLICSQKIHQIIVWCKFFKEWSDASSLKIISLQEFNLRRQRDISIWSTYLDAWSGKIYRNVSSIHLFIYSFVTRSRSRSLFQSFNEIISVIKSRNVIQDWSWFRRRLWWRSQLKCETNLDSNQMDCARESKWNSRFSLHWWQVLEYIVIKLRIELCSSVIVWI